MLGPIVNTVAVLVGGALGLLLKKGLPERIADTVMKGLGLCTLYIGLSGVMQGTKTLVLILSMVLGAILGSWIDLDDKLNRLGRAIERRFKRTDDKVSLAEGFVTATLLFCVGAMAIVGSLQSGLLGNHETLYTKSLLDFTAAIVFASSLGYGVLFSAGGILLYQGAIVLLAQWVAPVLNTGTVIAEMTCVGSLVIIGLALNMLGITKLKVMNYVPGIFLTIPLYFIL